MTRRILVLVALIGVMAGPGAGPATAAPSGKLDAQVIGHVQIDANDPTIAYVRARYICEGGEGAHLWVSVKQAESARPEQWLTEEGSGEDSAAWSHSHRGPVVCDGRWHVATFTVDQEEWGWGELRPGQAWVQFCIVPAGPEETITWSMRFAAVR